MFLQFFLDFWCWGATSAALGAPVRARGGSQGRFWSDLGGHFGAIGSPGVTYGAILEPRMVHFGVFFVVFALDMFLVANCCQNCLKKACPGTA